MILDPKEVDNKLSKGQVEEARGKVRSVEYDSCKNIFNHCNRKAPWSEETKSSHVSPLFKNNMARALFIEDTVAELENKIDVSFYCEAWRKGWGLAAVCSVLVLVLMPSSLCVVSVGSPAYTARCTGRYGCVRPGHGADGEVRGRFVRGGVDASGHRRPCCCSPVKGLHCKTRVLPPCRVCALR